MLCGYCSQKQLRPVCVDKLKSEKENCSSPHHRTKHTSHSPSQGNTSCVDRSLLQRCQGGNICQASRVHAATTDTCKDPPYNHSIHRRRCSTYCAANFEQDDIGDEEPFDVEDAVHF